MLQPLYFLLRKKKKKKKKAKTGFLKEAGAGYHGHSKQTLQLPAQKIKVPC